jgi:hypothetical protein
MTSILSTPPVEYYSRGLRSRFHLDAQRPVPAASLPAKFAEIGYEFDNDEYAARTEAVMREGGLETELPPGFPLSVSGPMVWSGSDIAEEEYVVQLGEETQAEVKAALQHFLGKYNPSKILNMVTKLTKKSLKLSISTTPK